MPLSPLRLIDRLFAPLPDAARACWLVGRTYAHRGLHSEAVAENSPSAFARAVDAGLGIECDIRLSADGHAIVFHDSTLERLAGVEGRLAAMSARAICATRMPVGGEAILTLRALLAQVAGEVPLLLELKADGAGCSVDGLCRAVRRDIAEYAGQLAVMSFDPRVGRWFGRHAPAILRGLVVTERDERPFAGKIRRRLALWQARAQFLAYDIRDLPSPFAQAQRTRGLPLLTWTVSTPDLRTRARQWADAPIAEGGGLAESEGAA